MLELSLTTYFVIGLVGLITIFDVYILIKKGIDATISRTLYLGACKYPIIAFALGVVCGHLFWLNN